MLEQFFHFIKKNKLFEPQERILLAVSGGIDSVVMAELFHQANFKFAIAHCNFQLRGKESDGDEMFVRNLADKYRVEFFSKHFNAKQDANDKKISIQMAARDLRYNWFRELIRNKKYNHISTAHHLNDSIETFFINLIRGTGIEGITGIDIKNNQNIRPMLFTRRNEIEHFAKENKLDFREDSSNGTDDYLRNKIRHNLIPVLSTLSPGFEHTMEGNLSRFEFAERLFIRKLTEMTNNAVRGESAHYITYLIPELQKEEDPEQLLFYMLAPYGFTITQCRDILNEKSSTQSGKMISSGNVRVLRHGEKILLSFSRKSSEVRYNISQKRKKLSIDIGMRSFDLFFALQPKTKKTQISSADTLQMLDAKLLKFPLKFRKWKAGDFFYPLGMKHRKKLSDFFVDQKVNLFDKENMYVLVSEDKIVCILGHRIDDRFKVTEKTKNTYTIKMKIF